MNAAVKQDFGAFLDYIDKYSMSSIAGDPGRVAHARLTHAQLLALLTAAAELLSDSGSVHDEFELSYGDPATSPRF